jgi:F-type H+-transporting ATPase subunit epsilon
MLCKRRRIRQDDCRIGEAEFYGGGGMTGKEIRLKILTPNKIVANRDLDFVLLRTVTGDMGILYGHEPCAMLLDVGMLKMYEGNTVIDTLAVLGGFAMVRDNQVVVTTELAEPPEMVQAVLARMEEEWKQNREKEQTTDLEMHRIEKALRNMLVHMDISSYSIIKGNEGNAE